MARIFVSYSRSNRRKVKSLIPLLGEVYGIENVWWDQNFYPGQIWWDEIFREIMQCDVFIYLMSSDSLESRYCRSEHDEALRLHKHILYVKLQNNIIVPDKIARIHYLDLSGPINKDSTKELIHWISEFANRPLSNEPPLRESPIPLPSVSLEEKRNYAQEYLPQIVVGLIVTIIGTVIAAFIIQADRFAPTPTPPPIVTQAETNLHTGQPTLSGFQGLPASENDTIGTTQQTAATETFAYATLAVLSETSTPPTTSMLISSTPTPIVSATRDNNLINVDLFSLGWWQSVRYALAEYWLLNITLYIGLTVCAVFFSALAGLSKASKNFLTDLVTVTLGIFAILFTISLYELIPVLITLALCVFSYFIIWTGRK